MLGSRSERLLAAQEVAAMCRELRQVIVEVRTAVRTAVVVLPVLVKGTGGGATQPDGLLSILQTLIASGTARKAESEPDG